MLLTGWGCYHRGMENGPVHGVCFWVGVRELDKSKVTGSGGAILLSDEQKPKKTSQKAGLLFIIVMLFTEVTEEVVNLVTSRIMVDICLCLCFSRI